MKVLLVVTFAILYFVGSNAVPTPIIHNGTEAKENDHSVIVLALAREGDNRAAFGGGSVISERHILTAAHLCVNAKQFLIGYGDIRARQVVRLRATSALIHGHFNAATLQNDIAIIPLGRGQTINLALATPVAITTVRVQIGDEGIVASFGFDTVSSNAISEHLLVGRQVVVDNSKCSKEYGAPVHVNQFCARDTKPIDEDDEDDQEPTTVEPETEKPDDDTEDNEQGGNETPGNGESNGFPNLDWSRMGRVFKGDDIHVPSSVCRGDTGSALVRKSGEGYVAYGIVARVPRGCNPDKPAVYTRLPSFTQWIEDATLGAARIVNY